MAARTIFDPNGSIGTLIYGSDYGAATIHDPNIAYDTVYYGLGGSDIIYDTEANGWIWANPNDSSPVYFYGRGGNDVLVGFGGNDWLYGDQGADILIGNNGNDAINGGDGFDQLWGGQGADQLNGDAGSDWVIGGGGGTALQRDVIAGGTNDGARDILIGANGSFDLFITSGNSIPDPAGGAATDIAWHFTLGEDKIRLLGSDAVTPGAQFYSSYSDTGLSGTLIYSHNSTAYPDIFLAGVNVTYAQLVANGALEFG